VKITDLLLEVDRWCDFTRHFTHLRTDQPTKDRPALLTVVLADAINLGLSKMAESCPGSSFHKLDTLRAWHVRDETYAKALAELVNYQHQLPFAAHWGGGTTSSSDGQRYPVGGRGRHAGSVNLRYGIEPGLTFYTHISDRYAPFHSKVIKRTTTVSVRDALRPALRGVRGFPLSKHLTAGNRNPIAAGTLNRESSSRNPMSRALPRPLGGVAPSCRRSSESPPLPALIVHRCINPPGAHAEGHDRC